MSTTDNASGLTTSYTYDTFGRVTALNVGGRVTNTAYDSRDRATSVSSSGTNIGYTYEDNRLKSINVHGAFNYNFDYDIYGNNTAISVNNALLASYSYIGSTGLMSKMTYGNLDEIGYSYDEDYRITQKTYLDKDMSGNVLGSKNVTYEYDLFGNVYETYDGFTGVTSRYYYDLLGRPTSMSRDDGISKAVSYDEFNRVQGYTIDTPLEEVNTSVDYNDLGVVTSTVNTLRGSQNKISYSYDPMLRLKERKLEAVNKTSQYSYLKGENGQDTMLVQTFNNGADTYSYTYNSFGNITSVRKNGVLLESYVYDSKNQLIQLTDSVTTYYYSYDDRGNITEYWEYDGGDMGGTTLGQYSYDTEWDDKLTYFNGTGITYDNIGNPNNWRDNMSFTWSYGRRLAGVTKGSDSYTYTYDADGLRTSKTVNGVKTDYYWVDGILQGQKTGSEYILFLYDENGTAYGMLVYNGSTTQYYYYLFNLQGDVVGIMDSTGATVVTYTYDVWGKLKGTSGTLASTIGVKNPIRYRGYYYDTETGFYYLQSRYYDPQVCRFINADGYVSTGTGILGYNMFAYCNNNPVNRVDPKGENADIAQWWTATMWWLCASDTALPVGDIIYVGGVVILWGIALYGSCVTVDTYIDTVPIEEEKAEEKEEVLPAPPLSEGLTYYHVTSPENAAKIINSRTLIGSNWEGGYVYAWKTRPSRYAIKNSGATNTGAIISFKTSATFVNDNGIDNPRVKAYGPVVSARPGPIKIWDVQVVG